VHHDRRARVPDAALVEVRELAHLAGRLVNVLTILEFLMPLWWMRSNWLIWRGGW
jgi:hypothetical protein